MLSHRRSRHPRVGPCGGPSRLALAALAALALAGPARAATEADPMGAPPQKPVAAAETDPIKVVVALLPFRVHSAGSLDYLETALVDLLATRLEATGRVRVLESVVVREAVVGYAADELTEPAVRDLAEELGADYIVTGSLTELAGRYSLDVRVTPVQSAFVSETMVFTAIGDDELLDRISELAGRVLSIVTSEPDVTVARVEVLGAEELDGEVGADLLTRVGQPYSSRTVGQDLAVLRALPGVATATVETEHSPEGVVVSFRLVPAAKLLASSAVPTDGDVVAEVHVAGNRRIEADAILARIGTEPGSSYRPARVAADVRAIYALGFFRNVRVLSEDGPDGRILTYEVEENPVVRRVTISGNDGVDSERIRDSLTLTTGATLDYPLLYENSARIEALYRAEGYYLAEVDHEVEPLSGNAVAIHFNVEENKKLRLREIEFEGNESLPDAELRRGLKTKVWHFWSYATRYLDNSGTYSEPVFAQDLRLVEQKYLDTGYLQVEVSEPDVIPVEKGLTVSVEIVEGKQYRVGEIDIAGDETVDLQALLAQLRLQSGEVFNRSYLTADVEQLTHHYTDRGFYFATVNPRTDLSDTDLVVDVTFEVEKGPLYFVRQIGFEGNTTTVDHVLRREMRMVEGQLYSARALQISQARLQNLGFFEEVNFEPVPTDYPGQIDVDVNVVERPTGSLSFGAGISSQDGFVVTGSLSQSNLFGRGYGVRLSVDVGGSSNRFMLSFTDPYVRDSDFSLSATAFMTDVQFEDFDQSQSGLDLVLGHPLNETNTTQGFLRYSFADRDIDQDSGVNAASLIFREVIDGESTTSLGGLTLRGDNRDDRVAPTRGGQWAGSMDFAGLGGFAKFLRLEGRFQRFFRAPSWFPAFPERSTFMVAARAGWAIPFNSISDWDLIPGPPGFSAGSESNLLPIDQIDTDLELPLSERYFLGGLGPYQLRGFKARSVGPRRAVLRRTGLIGTGSLFLPVGREVDLTQPDNTICNDTVAGNQGNLDGQCNNIDDEDDDDFDDLDETDVIGGARFLSLTGEYRFPISESLGLIGIAFLDMGNAFTEEESPFDVGNWRYGTGLGLLWFSPFGPLQAFVGIPIDPLEVEDNQVFEFSVGGSSF